MYSLAFPDPPERSFAYERGAQSGNMSLENSFVDEQLQNKFHEVEALMKMSPPGAREKSRDGMLSMQFMYPYRDDMDVVTEQGLWKLQHPQTKPVDIFLTQIIPHMTEDEFANASDRLKSIASESNLANLYLVQEASGEGNECQLNAIRQAFLAHPLLSEQYRTIPATNDQLKAIIYPHISRVNADGISPEVTYIEGGTAQMMETDGLCTITRLFGISIAVYQLRTFPAKPPAPAPPPYYELVVYHPPVGITPKAIIWLRFSGVHYQTVIPPRAPEPVKGRAWIADRVPTMKLRILDVGTNKTKLIDEYDDIYFSRFAGCEEMFWQHYMRMTQIYTAAKENDYKPQPIHSLFECAMLALSEQAAKEMALQGTRTDDVQTTSGESQVSL